MKYIKNITDENIEKVQVEVDGKIDQFDLPAGDVNTLKDNLAVYALKEFEGKVIEVNEIGEEIKEKSRKKKVEVKVKIEKKKEEKKKKRK